MGIRNRLPFLRLKGRGVLELLRLYGVLLLLLPMLPLSLYWLATNFYNMSMALGWLLFLCLALVVVLSAALGHTIARTILDPLRLLVQGANKIQEGEYGHIINIAETMDAPTEFKLLVLAFTLVYISWGTTYLAIKEGVKTQHLPPALFDALRADPSQLLTNDVYSSSSVPVTFVVMCITWL